MESSRWLTVLLIGLVLAGLVVGYFLLRNTFLPKTRPQTTQLPPLTQASPSPKTPADFVLGQNTESPSSPTPGSAFSRIAQRTQGNTSALPATGFQIALTGILSASFIIIGWKLRKYPH